MMIRLCFFVSISGRVVKLFIFGILMLRIMMFGLFFLMFLIVSFLLWCELIIFRFLFLLS